MTVPLIDRRWAHYRRRRRRGHPYLGNGEPILLVAPQIVGNPETGEVLTVIPGEYQTPPDDPVTDYDYQWSVGGIPVTGATEPEFVVPDEAEDQEITVEETASNNTGTSTPTQSPPTPPVVVVVGKPTNTQLPVVTGDPYIGATLTRVDGTWENADSISPRWRANGSNIPGPGNQPLGTETFVITEAYLGKTIDVLERAVNVNGATVAMSTPRIGPIVYEPQVPVNTVAPVVSGTLEANHTLSCTTGTWSSPSGAVTYSYQWYADDVAISGETSATLLLTTGLIGAMVYCDVTGTNASGSATVSSNEVGPIAEQTSVPPTATIAPRVAGLPVVGETLTRLVGTWNDNGFEITNTTYQWFVDDVAVSGETGSTFVLGPEHEGATVKVQESKTNAGGTTDSMSTASAVVLATEPTYDNTESATFFAAMATQEVWEWKDLVDTFISELKAASIWDAFGLIGIYAMTREMMGNVVSLKNVAHKGTPNSGISFVRKNGLKGDGTSGVVTWNVALTNISGWAQNAAGISLWSKTDVSEVSRDFGTIGSANLGCSIRQSNKFYLRINSGSANFTVASTNSSGFFHFRRTSSSAMSVRRNLSAIGSGSATSSAPPVSQFCTHATAGSQFSSRNLAVIAVGRNLSNIESDAAYNAFENLVTGISALT